MQANKAHELIEPKEKLDAKNNKKYKVKTICNSKIYGKKTLDQVSRLYYLVS